jgi:outer membrane immunogenic protein
MLRLLASSAAIALMSTAAFAADLPLPVEPIPVAPVAPPVYNWTGFYGGIQGGWKWWDISTPAANFVQPDGDSGIIGGYIGANYQWNWAVLGLEADGDWVVDGENTQSCFNPAFDCTAELEWEASLRGRLGVAFDRVLIYATGGAAWAGFQGETQIVATGVDFQDDATLFGWTVGGGLEFAVTNNLLLKGEYRFTDYNEEDMNYDVTYPDVDVDTHAVRFGLAYKFGPMGP